MSKHETLGQLLKRRMTDLQIKSAAELGRRIGCSRGYATHLINDTSSSKRGQYVPEPNVVKKIAVVVGVPETDILRSINYLSPISLENTAFAFFGGGKNLSSDQWEEILNVSRTLIAQKERQNAQMKKIMKNTEKNS